MTIDPEVLTPAGKRAVHRIRTAFAILIVGVAGAMYALSHQVAASTACTTKRGVWDFERHAVVALTAPRPLDDHRLTGQQRALRLTSNVALAQTRKTLLKSLGDRPSC